MDSPSIRNLQAVSDPVGQLWLVEIDVIGRNDPVRLVQDTRNWTIDGQTYIGLPMRITPPQNVEGEAARATLQVDNIGRDMVPLLDALPPGTALECVMKFVRRDAPDIVQWEWSTGISRADASSPMLSFTLGDDDLMRRPAVLIRIDPTTRPGLFKGTVQ